MKFAGTRTGDWERALAAYIAACEAKPYAWGEHDCAMFAAGAVLAMTGIDPVPEFRGRYRTAAGSVRALRRHGAGTLLQTMDAKFERVGIGFARRGDLAWLDGSVGVVAGPFALFVGAIVDDAEQEQAGLIRAPRAAWQAAWRVG